MSITTSRPNSCRKSSASLGDERDRERIVAVHVEDRHLDHLRDVGGVHRGARVFRQGGEADLIVHHDVDRAAGAVAGELRHVQRLRHDSLPGESGIAVDQQRQNFAAMLGVAANPLPRARCSFHHGIDRFEMARIGREADLDFGARRPACGWCDSRGDISRRHRPPTRSGHVVLGELGEDDLERFLAGNSRAH